MATAAILAMLTINACKDSSEQEPEEQTEAIDTSHIHRNNLKNAESGLQLNQAESLIHWQPWSKQVFADAEAEKKTLFAFVGSGTDPYTVDILAQLNQSQQTCETLNKHHVNLLIDSNLHPDLEFFETRGAVGL